jgi:hypothetical protein
LEGTGMTYVIVYIIGAILTAGFIGGIRDEMEGIADIFIIGLWPISAVIWLLIEICKVIYAVGNWLK